MRIDPGLIRPNVRGSLLAVGRFHEAKAGDNLARIAKAHGFRQWNRIYQAPENAELRKLRPDPELLAPGDRVFIPDRETKWLASNNAKVHTFVVQEPTHKITLRLHDMAGKAIAGAEYELKVGDETHTGVVPSSGIIEHEVSLAVEDATLTLHVPTEGPGSETCELVLPCKLGHLGPAQEVVGVQARLTNLGLYEANVDGSLGPTTTAALARFRELAKLEPGDGIDDVVRSELIKRAGV